jgi:imidazolonepropionase-like amidohydrolase
MMEPIRTYALTGATVIDGHGGAPLNDTTVLVENGVIKAVGIRESIIVEDNISEIDVGGHFILPGLIDAHVHLVGVGSP